MLGVGPPGMKLFGESSRTDPVPIGPHHAGAELVQDAESGLVPAQTKLPLKLHRGHAFPCVWAMSC